MSESTTALDESNFTETIATSDKPVLVDFWAEWCGPCLQLAPILEEVAAENAEKITVAKVNVDENPDIARQFDIMQIPTMIVFDKGQPAARFMGASGKSSLLNNLSEFLD